MIRTFMVLAAVLFTVNGVSAQTSSGSTATHTGTTATTETPEPKKKKGREWGRFSSQRVDEEEKPKIGQSLRSQ